MILLVLIAFVAFGAIYSVLFFGELNDYYTYVEEKTIFFFKEKPEITCVITDIVWEDYINPRIHLLVRYPSGNTVNMMTTFKEFNLLWNKNI